MKGRVLIVDDDPDLGALLEAALGHAGYEVVVATSGDEGLRVVEERDFDVILTDIHMPGISGIEFCERVAASRPGVPLLVMTAFATLEKAVAAMRVGAEDFITKPLKVEAVALRLDKMMRLRKLHSEVQRLNRLVEEAQAFDEIIGDSPVMKRLQDMMSRMVDSDASILITGESGTGKELVARALHRQGKRSTGPFVPVNCAAIPANLLESELFGHVKGSFTGAASDKPGLFVDADGGTLFLDEVGELPLELQPKLLRVLEERAVRPVGGGKERAVDVRIVAATNRDLESEVEEGRFREDLYFRINVVSLEVPPLRARGSDVLVLAQYFLAKYAAQSKKKIDALSPEVAERLTAYTWPGNVRELRNCLERAVALARFDKITVEDLPERIREYKRSHVIVASDDPSELVPMEEVEKRYITRVLESVGGNKTLAAKVLGFDRKTLYRKLDRYHIEVERKDD